LKISQHLTENLSWYVLLAVLGLAGAGALAYMDVRHITQLNWIDAQIENVDAEIEELELWNAFGSENNKPARDQIILRKQNKKERLERRRDGAKE
jgi:hypothetical protein